MDSKKGLLNKEIVLKALDNLIECVQITDGEGHILFVNETFKKYTDISTDFLLGKRSIDFPAIYSPSIVSIAIKEKKKISAILDGISGPALATASPIFNSNGKIEYVVTTAYFIKDIRPFLDYMIDEQGSRENQQKQLEFSAKSHYSSVNEVYQIARRISKTDSNVIITGETGVGKSLLAQYIHNVSNRNKGVFLEVNCAAIPESLVESELFGYTPGAFTGALKSGKAGFFENASGGTLFLDEIGELPLQIQVKLLHAIQNKKITRIGGNATIPIDIRLITATSRDLKEMVEKGEFRSELYYRIKVVEMNLPPLRERKADIPDLVDLFLSRYNKQYGTKIQILSEVVKVLQNHSFPGNIRELENTIESLIVTNISGIITLNDIPTYIFQEQRKNIQKTVVSFEIDQDLTLKEVLENVERIMINKAYDQCASSYQVAKKLGISQSSANRKILKYVK